MMTTRRSMLPYTAITSRRRAAVRVAAVEEREEIGEPRAIVAERRDHVLRDAAVEKERFEVRLVISCCEDLGDPLEGEASDGFPVIVARVRRLAFEDAGERAVVTERRQMKVDHLREVVVRPHRLNARWSHAPDGLHYAEVQKMCALR